jgi:hypothetical protein
VIVTASRPLVRQRAVDSVVPPGTSAVSDEGGAFQALPPHELVIFGSGSRIRFAAPAVLRPLIERGIGIETMDTAAACRTYNVLASEGRAVVAALLIEARGAPREVSPPRPI